MTINTIQGIIVDRIVNLIDSKFTYSLKSVSSLFFIHDYYHIYNCCNTNSYRGNCIYYTLVCLLVVISVLKIEQCATVQFYLFFFKCTRRYLIIWKKYTTSAKVDWRSDWSDHKSPSISVRKKQKKKTLIKFTLWWTETGKNYYSYAYYWLILVKKTIGEMIKTRFE